MSIGASIGLAEVPGDQPTPPLDELFSRADIAMYAAKRAGKGQLALYESSMVLPEAADLHYRPLLDRRDPCGAIDCVFQPIIDLNYRPSALRGGAGPVGGRRAERAQAYFIELAGRLRLLPALADLMMDRACAQLADWSTRFDCATFGSE